MREHALRFIVRTPHEVVFDGRAQSIRLLTETGHVGLRVRMEPIVLPVESGLAVVRTNGAIVLVGSAGGLLTSDGREATLFTPLAVVGREAAAVQRAIEAALAGPSPEIAIRRRLGRLEDRILAQLRHRPDELPVLAGERR